MHRATKHLACYLAIGALISYLSGAILLQPDRMATWIETERTAFERVAGSGSAWLLQLEALNSDLESVSQPSGWCLWIDGDSEQQRHAAEEVVRPTCPSWVRWRPATQIDADWWECWGAGFPFVSVRYANAAWYGEDNQGSVVDDRFELLKLLGGRIVIPYGIYWPGFLANTAIYSTILVGIGLLARWVRRVRTANDNDAITRSLYDVNTREHHAFIRSDARRKIRTLVVRSILLLTIGASFEVGFIVWRGFHQTANPTPNGYRSGFGSTWHKDPNTGQLWTDARAFGVHVVEIMPDASRNIDPSPNVGSTRPPPGWLAPTPDVIEWESQYSLLGYHQGIIGWPIPCARWIFGNTAPGTLGLYSAWTNQPLVRDEVPSRIIPYDVMPLLFGLNAIIIALAVLPFWLAVVALTRFAKRRQGRCIRCGYDLTGITGQCPECGVPEYLTHLRGERRALRLVGFILLGLVMEIGVIVARGLFHTPSPPTTVADLYVYRDPASRVIWTHDRAFAAEAVRIGPGEHWRRRSSTESLYALPPWAEQPPPPLLDEFEYRGRASYQQGVIGWPFPCAHWICYGGVSRSPYTGFRGAWGVKPGNVARHDVERVIPYHIMPGPFVLNTLILAAGSFIGWTILTMPRRPWPPYPG